MPTDKVPTEEVSADSVVITWRGTVMTITLNRPDSLNSLTKPVIADILTALEKARDSADAVVLTGGDRAFCSGADLRVQAVTEQAIGVDLVAQLVRTISDLPVPVIAAVSGAVVGVGCSLALICDYIVCSDSAYMMLPFNRIGLMPDGGATTLVAASAGRHRALRMALTGEKVPAAQCYSWGLVSEVAGENYGVRAQRIAEQWAAGSRNALAHTRAAINAASLHQLDAALGRETAGQRALLDSQDFAEGVQAFHEKRPPRFNSQ